MKYIDKIEIMLRGRTGDLFPYYIDVLDNPLAHKWLRALNTLLNNGYHLEKNYHWMGFSDRGLSYMSEKINNTISAINDYNTEWNKFGLKSYIINDYFSIDNTLAGGEVGDWLPGLTLLHDKFNNLHLHFEVLQGQSGKISKYYKTATPSIKWHIRQLNLLCHEFESRALSYRKEQYAPEWAQYNQLFCFFNTPKFKLDEKDHSAFGLDTLTRHQGDIFMGINKSVGKSHFEVFTDEGDVDINDTVTTSLTPQWQGSGDFDISWSQSSQGKPWHEQGIKDFVNWLKRNKLDPDDPKLTLGHPKVGSVNMAESFPMSNFSDIQTILKRHLDVYRIRTTGHELYLDYRWSDQNYINSQIALIK